MTGTTTRLLPSLALAMLAAPAAAQQVSDTNFRPEIAQPTHAPGAGPRVAIDGAHHEFHTVDGRYAPFAALLRRDGYVVRGNAEPFTATSLGDVDVLVIANALATRNVENWTLPTPSAFTAAEVAAVRAWVEAGGSLLLIADHMPFPGGASAFAAAFGIEWSNGFATWPGDRTGTRVYRREDGSLASHPITDGAMPEEWVDSVASFTGSAFRATGARPDVVVEPLMVLPADAYSLEPHEAWVFDDTTPRRDVAGWLQGAALTVGRGRVVLMGEAAMLTAQLAGPNQRKMGMNNPVAAQNWRFALNLVRWLTSEP